MDANELVKKIEALLMQYKNPYVCIIGAEEGTGVATGVMVRGMSNAKAIGFIELKKCEFTLATLKEMNPEKHGGVITKSTPTNIN